MADEKFSQFTAAQALADADIVPLSQDVAGTLDSRRTTLGAIKTFVATAGGMTNPMTTAGDLITGGTAGAPARLAKGTDGQVLQMAAGAVAWGPAGGFTGGSLTSALNEAKGASIASATTTNIGAGTGNLIHVTGTATITGLGTVQAGTRRIVVFDGALTLTHNATSLVLPTGANITTAAGDAATFVSEGSGNWRCVSYQRANGTPLAGGGGGGGLTNWVEALSTGAPNASVPVVSLSVTNGATNVDAAVIPKGSGAVLAAIPDSGAGGGNKRGANAVDWQTKRETAAQVAFGAQATVGGGYSNTAQGAQSTVAGGFRNVATGGTSAVGGGSTNTASASSSTVGGGLSNSASASYSTVGGGQENIASGQNSAVAGGRENEASGNFSWTPGGQRASTRGLYGAGARASSYHAATGDCQSMCMVLKALTTTATQGVATSDGAAASATNQMVLPNNSAYVMKGMIVARQHTTGDSASWEFTVHVKRGSTAESTELVASATVAQIAADTNAAAWAVAIEADAAFGALAVKVTGEASKSIRWTTDIYSCVQVQG